MLFNLNLSSSSLALFKMISTQIYQSISWWTGPVVNRFSLSLDGEFKMIHQSVRWSSAEINGSSSEHHIKFSKKEININSCKSPDWKTVIKKGWQCHGCRLMNNSLSLSGLYSQLEKAKTLIKTLRLKFS